MHFTASVNQGWQKNMTSQFSVTKAYNNEALEDRIFQYSGTPNYETVHAKSCLIFLKSETIYGTKNNNIDVLLQCVKHGTDVRYNS